MACEDYRARKSHVDNLSEAGIWRRQFVSSPVWCYRFPAPLLASTNHSAVAWDAQENAILIGPHGGKAHIGAVESRMPNNLVGFSPDRTSGELANAPTNWQNGWAPKF